MVSKLKPIILIACGSFNPPTIMHLRLFELAKDHLQEQGFRVMGGVMSPTNDKYTKKGLISSTHRVEMVRLALEDYGFVKLSTWEAEQPEWSLTRLVLETHQDAIKNFCNGNSPKLAWMPDQLEPLPTADDDDNIPRIVFVCGADLLESFSVPNLWIETDIEKIVSNFGLVVISREGSNPSKFIFEHDILHRFTRNVHLVTERVPNMISSTCIRLAVRRNQSIKFLVPSKVADYISSANLYKMESDGLKIEYSCMPLPEFPVVNYFPEQSNQETQITLNETLESETQTPVISTECQNTQSSVDTSEMTTQTKKQPKDTLEMTTQTKAPKQKVTLEMTTQTKTHAQMETTTQTKTCVQTEMTTQTKSRDKAEITTQTKPHGQAEIPTQTKILEQKHSTMQTSFKAEDNLDSKFQNNSSPVSEVKIVLEVHTDEEEAAGEAPDVDDIPDVDGIPDVGEDVPPETLITIQNPCPVPFHEDFPAPEFCACSNVMQDDVDSKVDENECSFSCSSECSSCSCLDPSHTLESQMSPALNTHLIFEAEVVAGLDSISGDVPPPCTADDVYNLVSFSEFELVETGDERDDTEPTIIEPLPIEKLEEKPQHPATHISEDASHAASVENAEKSNLEMEDKSKPELAEKSKPEIEEKPKSSKTSDVVTTPKEMSVKEHRKSRSKHHGDRSEKSSSSGSAPAVQFEITSRGVRVISEKESFL